MKSNIFGGLKDKVKKLVDVSDEGEALDFDEDEEYDDYDDQEEEAAPESGFSSGYGTDSGYGYKYSGGEYTAPSSDFGYGDYSSASVPASDTGRFTKKKGTNIYQMNSAAASSSHIKVNRVVYFYLEDREDARNIADCMVAQDAVVLLDMSNLNKEDAMCVLHFLDGVKYIYKSKMETIATNVYLIVPNSIELAGDFYDQVSPDTFY